jgi:hypothetical protein
MLHGTRSVIIRLASSGTIQLIKRAKKDYTELNRLNGLHD